MYELAEEAFDAGRPRLLLVQDREKIELVRCPCCDGLRSISVRQRKSTANCPDCRRGDVYRREIFHSFWLEHFSHEEIVEMSRALFG